MFNAAKLSFLIGYRIAKYPCFDIFVEIIELI